MAGIAGVEVRVMFSGRGSTQIKADWEETFIQHHPCSSALIRVKRLFTR
jgi:hypothetical protein